jgi:hypothetical protein
MSEVYASAKFVRDNTVKEVQVVKVGKRYTCQHLMNGKLVVMPDWVKVPTFATLDDAINKVGKESLAGWRNLLKMARWSEVA